MVLLRENFIQLQYFGLWKPLWWPSNKFKSRAYGLYTIQILIMMYCFTISETLSLFDSIDNIEDFSSICFMLLTMIATCVKAMVILLRRSEIIDILKTLEVYPHKPMTVEEDRIQEKVNRRIRFFTLFYGGVIECSIWTMSISAFFQGIPFGVLPCKGWIPYDYAKPELYWFTFCLQLFITIISANTCIGSDTVMPGFYTLICAQFNILKCRLQKAVDESESEVSTKSSEICEKKIIHCIQYHRAIFEISERINSVSSGIIFVQYSASSFIICLSIFMVSQMPPFSTQWLYFTVYLMSMMLQIFLFCASAHEATTECQSIILSIYSTKWYHLGRRARSYLNLMMVRTLRPVIFKSGSIIVLSINSFSNVRSQGENMEALQDSFTLLQYCGMWPPLHWSSNSVKSKIYHLYTICILAMINWFIVTEVFSLSEIGSVEDIADNCFMLMSMIAASGKTAIILIKREEVIDILNALDNYPHTSVHVDEQKIQKKFNRRIRLIFLFYAGQFEIGVWFMSTLVYMQKLPFGVLPYKAWIPWDYSAPKMYWFLYWLQMTTVIVGANVVSACDTLISGFMVLICGQFNILRCRLERTIAEFKIEFSSKPDSLQRRAENIFERRIVACTKYHYAILEMAQKINSIFTIIIFIQYTASSIILCVSVLIMSQMPVTSAKFMSLFTYVWCMVLEIFMLCASANAATVECESMIQNIYYTVWYRVPEKVKKCLLLMMVRTLRPILFTSGYIIVLSLQSFTKLLKLSYSIYTVLQQSMK
ncbi:uncharacterized protein LOC135165410 [Diachasmimorpha longicaudata]|uniref:uncharacterized protein LOC135165410 n=1 Tax=Diachasmimorpha longicaudata TaxID=58733 RepID=UPI0030B86DF6